MTVFITPCWRKLRRLFEQTLVPGFLIWALAGPAGAAAELEQLRVERQDQAVLLNAVMKLDLGPAVEDALLKGVAVHFVAEAELMRDRWYWYDRKVAQVSRYYRLAYQPLTRQWRLQISGEPLSASGSGSSIAQSFDSLSSVLDVIRRQSGWKLAEASHLEPDARQYVVYRFRLDISQLPRPFQIAAGSQAGWNLGVSRTLRIQPEAGS